MDSKEPKGCNGKRVSEYLGRMPKAGAWSDMVLLGSRQLWTLFEATGET